MPIKKSAFKELRKTKKRAARNRTYLKQVKEAIKKASKALAAKNTDQAKAAAARAVQLLDKAAQKRMIHKNKTARQKSRLWKKFGRP